VYSTGLHTVGTRVTRLERTFDPQEVRAVTESADGRVEIGGATIAAEGFRLGLVDEVELYLSPVMVGGGLRALPGDVRLSLSLLEEHHFSSGVVFLSYAVQR
jgi:riboflavin biosynthesis pyrimidine reductase